MINELITDYTLKYDINSGMVTEGNKVYVFHPITGEQWTPKLAELFIQQQKNENKIIKQ
jgi:hypothetical protein